MIKLLQNSLFRSLLSTLVFGGLYALLTFLFNGALDIKNLIISVVTYFVMLQLMYFIAPKLQKLTGWDKKSSEK